MIKVIHTLLVISLSVISSLSLFSQTIPTDSLYLGQTPPGNIPKTFKLSVSPGLFAAERIAISNNGKEIYYSEVKKYYPLAGDTVKYYSYSGDKWTGPFNVFEGYNSPAFSLTGDTMYFQNKNVEAFFSFKNGLSWNNPKRIFANLSKAHYSQVTNNGNYYVSSIPKTGIGAADWCRLIINGTDTDAVSLGLPLNSGADDQDFFVSRDEKFMIVAQGGLKISFHKNDGSWSYPRSLGATINFGLGMWGTYVSPDNKYLFYTTGTLADYSDTYVYWVRIDGLIDSLKHSNSVPYLKSPLLIQRCTVGNLFTYQIPDTIFIDDDGNNTLTFSAKLSNGNPLPNWLLFDSTTRTFSGIPPSSGGINVNVTATDTAHASVSCTFRIAYTNPDGVMENKDYLPKESQLYQNYPNPFNPTTEISYQIPANSNISLKVFDILGKEIATLVDERKVAGKYTAQFSTRSIASGIYFYEMRAGSFVSIKKMIMMK